MAVQPVDTYNYHFPLATSHAVLGSSLLGPWPEGAKHISFGMGCFWGAERIFWRIPGVTTTAVGYQGGNLPYPTYEQVCAGITGHAEVAHVVYDPAEVGLEVLLKEFWENHDPTQGMRQGNDVGSQYRSAIYYYHEADQDTVTLSRQVYDDVVTSHGYPSITTELRPVSDAGPFYYAEQAHQQYLHKNPFGYCNHGFNGMSCPIGLVSGEA